MKLNFQYMILLFLSLMIYESKASEPDSLQKQESGIDLYAIGGLGMTTGSTGGGWDNYFYNGPAIALGLELPFTSSHIFALQLYWHSWMSHKRENSSSVDRDRYIIMNDNSYSLMSFSLFIKYYLYLFSKNTSLSLYCGNVLLTKTNERPLFECGIGINHKLNEKIIFGIMYRLSVPVFDILSGGSGSYAPNYLMLEFSYKIM